MTKSNKATYVDGFVLVVKKDKVSAYKKMAKEGAKVWLSNGALSYKECIGEDLSPSMGGMTMLTFPKLMKLKEDETVWFSFIEYKSKSHRNQVNAKVMKAMEKQYGNNPEKVKEMPFNLKRMAYGGFTVAVSD